MELKFNDKYLDTFNENKLIFGRMVGGSKTRYVKNKPNNIVIFNANIFTLEDGKIWFGDIDVTESEKDLKRVSKQLNKTLYVLTEYPGRWKRDNDRCCST
jgi:hypothetical protein